MPVAAQAQLAQAPLLDVVHPNRGADWLAFRDRGIAEKTNLRDDGRQPVHVNNPIYAEVVPRELTWVVQEEFDQETAWYVDADGGLNVGALLAAFQTFFREHSEHWSKRFQYQEAWAQLLLQAFLQRVVNSGGRIEREYGLGRGRTDLLIVWPRGARAPGRCPHDGPSHAGGGRAAARRQDRDRMQAALRQPGTDRRGGPGADGGLHGPVRGVDGVLRYAVVTARTATGSAGQPFEIANRRGPGIRARSGSCKEPMSA